MPNKFLSCPYIPILAIKPAEISAIDELPDKDKDCLLPLFPIRGWSSAHHLSSAVKKIHDCIDDRPWIADIEEKFLSQNKQFMFTGSYPDTPVYKELAALLDPSDGYDNWYQFLLKNESAIPCIQHGSMHDIELQINKLSSLGRGVVFRVCADPNNISKHSALVEALKATTPQDALIIYDLESVDLNYAERIPLLEHFISESRGALKDVAIAISGSSFPTSFSGQAEGEFSIYERLLFNKINGKELLSPLIYSDWGSARAQKQGGGGGTPPPRIDYPLKKDWKFVRREVEDNIPNSKEKRMAAYIEIAKEIKESDYWIPELRLWGTQQIELTAEANEFAIYSPKKSTAVRINIHLYTQLHYNSAYEEMNTDEEWVD